MTRIPSEDLYAFNIDRQIEDYFSIIGYEVHAIDKPTRRKEVKLGFDSLFKDSRSLKYFALQHKRPSRMLVNGCISFELVKHQNQIIFNNRLWMFYSFPLFSDSNLLHVSLHHTIFTDGFLWPSVHSSHTIRFCPPIGYTGLIPIARKSHFLNSRCWGIFSKQFLACQIGQTGTDITKVESILLKNKLQLSNYSYYVFDLKTKKILIVRDYDKEGIEDE